MQFLALLVTVAGQLAVLSLFLRYYLTDWPTGEA